MPQLLQLRTRRKETLPPSPSALEGVQPLDGAAVEDGGLFVTQYLYRHKLSSDSWLLCNTLTGAVDARLPCTDPTGAGAHNRGAASPDSWWHRMWQCPHRAR